MQTSMLNVEVSGELCDGRYMCGTAEGTPLEQIEMLTWAMEGNYVDGGLGALRRRDLGSVLCLGFGGCG